MNGHLDEHPLGELIREISAAGLSGALRLTRERAKSVIYFDYGEVVFATSNLRATRLHETAKRFGLITDEQHMRVSNASTDREVASLLVSSGALTEQAIGKLWSRQISDVLCLCLLWTFGTWQFDPRSRYVDEIKVSVDVKNLILESARRLPVGFINTRFRNQNEIFRQASTTEEPTDLLPIEAFVLSQASTPMSLAELKSSIGMAGAEGISSIYALVIAGWLMRAAEPRAFSNEEIEKSKPINRPKPVVPTPAQPHKAEQPVLSEPQPSDPKQELEEMFRRLERSGDFYGVLGVTRRASPDAIKQAYHSLARKFHPDRYRKEADHTLYLRIEGAFARFAQAYETLKDQKSRAVYDLKLEARPVRSQAAEKPETPKTEKATPQAREPIKPNSQAPGQPPTVAPTGKAELLFQSGMAALEQGKMNVAANYFGEAARTEPTNASYRGYYGKALAGFGSSQRQAEAEIQSAITLDPKNALFHVMLAELYLSLGFERRARVEFKKAIALDARLDDAREALARIDSNLRAQAQK